MPGPLHGITVVEMASIGPAPFCGMVLADLGAEVIRVDRPDSAVGLSLVAPQFDLHNRGKKSISIDLKHQAAAGIVLDLVENADVLIEGLRPGVMEKLGVGPHEALARNPRLVYGRMTGWGQEGPYASTAGHDIDYIAVAGLLHTMGSAGIPTVPPNYIGDYGGGGMLLVIGVLAGCLAARTTGQGQVVDAAMVDGAALLSTSLHGFLAGGLWEDRRESNLLDGGAPFYAVYRTSDDRHMAVGALEPQFFSVLVDLLALPGCPEQGDRQSWPAMRSLFAERFASETQEHWIEVFSGSDACVAPVRSLTDAPIDPHLDSRSTFVDVGGIRQPAPAPRFSGSDPEAPGLPSTPAGATAEILESLGYSELQIGKLRLQGAIG